MSKLTIHKLGKAIVFRCTGRIGFGECHILRTVVFSHAHIAMAVLDMAQVNKMDAAGLGLLVELRNWASAKRIQLKLLNLNYAQTPPALRCRQDFGRHWLPADVLIASPIAFLC